MKRSELVVGAELYHAKPRDWANNSTDHRGARVTVVSIAPYTRESYSWNKIYETSKGTGVLVTFFKKDGTPDDRQDVVQLAHLRGPYAEVAAQVAGQREADRKAGATLASQRDAVRRYVEKARARATAAGFTDVRSDTPWDRTSLTSARLSVSAAELLALIDRVG